MVFLRVVTGPNRSKHLLANPAVELTYTVNFLTSVAGKCRQAEALAMVFGVLTAHADELIPCKTEALRITTHVLSEQCFVEIVVAEIGRAHVLNSSHANISYAVFCLKK